MQVSPYIIVGVAHEQKNISIKNKEIRFRIGPDGVGTLRYIFVYPNFFPFSKNRRSFLFEN